MNDEWKRNGKFFLNEKHVKMEHILPIYPILHLIN